jgi:hypothetical protein
VNRPIRAIAAGAAATTAMMVILLVAQVQTRAQLGAPEAIARFAGVPGRTYVGLAIFVAAGVLVWPIVFAVVEDYLAGLPGGRDAAIRGVAFGLVLWVAFLVLGTGDLTWPFVLLYLLFTLIGHLAYGFTLSVVYQRLG